MSRTPRPEQIQLLASDPSPAVAAFAERVAARSGWVNLFPEVDEEDVVAVTPSVIGALFRAPGPPIPQATLLAPTTGRRGSRPGQLGITHGVGAMVLARLAADGVERPAAWTVVQDHVRRGIVLELDDPPDPHEAVTWAIRAGTLLCPVPTTGGWLAEVHTG